MLRGGHDPRKVYAAYRAAVEHKGKPTVILAKTIKGYGLGEAGEGRNITHQQKKMNENALRDFRDRFSIPISDEKLAKCRSIARRQTVRKSKYMRERRPHWAASCRDAPETSEPLQVPPASTLRCLAQRLGRPRNLDHDGVRPHS